jgi:recombination protein RecT
VSEQAVTTQPNTIPTTTPNGQGTAPAKKPRTVLETLAGDERFKESLSNALPKHIPVDRMLRVCMTALRRTPKLLQTSPESLLGAIMVSGQLGLEPNDPRQLAYLIPYGSECQFIIGYRGYIELAMRSGMVTSIQAMPVYEKDDFEYEQGLELKLRHVPYLGTEDPGKVKCAYAIATMKDGSKAMVVIPRRDIDRAREASKTGQRGPWVDWFPEMAMKTAVRRLAKFMPQSPEFAQALDADENRARLNPMTMDLEIEPNPIDGDTAPALAGSEQQASLSDKLNTKAAKTTGVKTEMRPEPRDVKAEPVSDGGSRFTDSEED